MWGASVVNNAFDYRLVFFFSFIHCTLRFNSYRYMHGRREPSIARVKQTNRRKYEMDYQKTRKCVQTKIAHKLASVGLFQLKTNKKD